MHPKWGIFPITCGGGLREVLRWLQDLQLGPSFSLAFSNQVIIDQLMGQCQVQKSQLKIEVLHIQSHELRSDVPLQTCLYSYPPRHLKIEGVVQKDLADSSLEGVRSQSVTLTDEGQLHVELQCKKYDYLSSGLLFENQGLQISQILTDELHCDRLLYLVRKNRQNYSLIVRKFTDCESKEFLNALYEINTYETIAGIESPYLHKMVKNFTIQSNNQFINHHSKVIVLQPVTANLSLIIKHRRATKTVWTIAEFYVLMKNLVEAVATLHDVGLVHNDIRPSNVYYSEERKCFVLGCYENVDNANASHASPPPNKDNFYRDAKKRKNSVAIENTEDKNKKLDVYSLGMTLLSSFYLMLLIDRKKSAPYNRFLVKDYPFLEIIGQMICRLEKRSSIFDIRDRLKELSHKYHLQTMTTVPLEDYSLISKNYVDIYKRERFIADGYKMLGLISNWKERLKNRHIHKKICDNSVESAKYYQELAVISNIQGKIQKSKNYYIHSAEIYYKIGTTNFIERDFQNAVTYFQQGLDNFSIIQNKQTDLTYLKLLVSLYQAKIVSGFSLVQSHQLTKLWRLIYEIKQVQPFAFWQYVLQLINIYKYYQNYNKIYDLLQICLEVAPHIETKIGTIILEKMVIENNLKLAELKSLESVHRRSIIAETEVSIFNILNDKQYYFISHPLQKIQLNLLAARTKVLKGAHREAINQLEELAAYLESDYRDDSGEGDRTSNTLRNKYCLLRCEILVELGNIWYHLQEMNESFKYFSKAVQNYQEYFGDIYNIECAILLEKIGQINKKRKNSLGYTDSLDLVLKILKTEYGKYHKDILRLNQSKKSERNDFMDITSIKGETIRSFTDIESFTQW